MFPYSAEAFFAFLEQYNRAIWPAQAIAVLLALFALWLVTRPSRAGSAVVGAMLVAAWLWNAIVYYLVHLRAIDFVAPGFALLMLIQGLVLGGATLGGGLVFRSGRDRLWQVAMIAAVLALVYDPAVAALGGQGWETARVAGLAPGPTVLFTIAVLAMCERAGPYLLVIPVLWSASAVAFAWILGIAPDLVLPLAGIALAGPILWRRFRARAV